jgi:hypothetical protein
LLVADTALRMLEVNVSGLHIGNPCEGVMPKGG